MARGSDREWSSSYETVDPERADVYCLGRYLTSFNNFGMGVPMNRSSNRPLDITETFQKELGGVGIERLNHEDACRIESYNLRSGGQDYTPQRKLRLQFFYLHRT